MHDELVLSLEEPGWASIRRASAAGGWFDQSLLPLPEGFTLEDVRDALTATGWVSTDGEVLYLLQSKSCCDLSEITLELFSYFESSGEPRRRLREVAEAVTEYSVVQDAQLQLSWWAYAWLDLIVRDDLAEEARGVTSVWRDTLQLDAGRLAERRVREMVERYGREALAVRRMASSVRSRDSLQARKHRAS